MDGRGKSGLLCYWPHIFFVFLEICLFVICFWFCMQAELICRVAVLLLQLHHSQLVATVSSRPILTSLHEVFQDGVKVGFEGL